MERIRENVHEEMKRKFRKSNQKTKYRVCESLDDEVKEKVCEAAKGQM